MNKNNSKKGISLVETIVYVAIFGLFIVGLVNFSNLTSSSRLHNQIVFEVNGQGFNALEKITKSIRNAVLVSSPTASNTASSITLNTATPSTDPTVFSITDGVLYITEGSGTPIPLTNNKVIVSNLSFTNLSPVSTPGVVKVSFTLSSAITKDNYTLDFTGSASLR